MEASAWEFLQQRPFGSLYFPCTGPPWPEDIAEGDTDGDLSLVCWDDELVPLLAERCSPCSLAVEPPVEGARVERLGDDWLAQTHAHMLDPQTVQEQMHIGKVYTLMVKKGDAHGWFASSVSASRFEAPTSMYHLLPGGGGPVAGGNACGKDDKDGTGHAGCRLGSAAAIEQYEQLRDHTWQGTEPDGSTPLYVDSLRAWVETGGSVVDARFGDSRGTALIEAANGGHREAVEWLLDNGRATRVDRASLPTSCPPGPTRARVDELAYARLACGRIGRRCYRQ